jgi:ABC-2 type transport system ATP-binding protein
MSFVQVANLRIQYGKLTAVDQLSFEIPPGEVFGFIGPNGAGKSSTIRVLATLQKPTAGTVRIDGLDVTRDAARIRRIIGYMPDAFGVYEDLTVEQYLHFFAAAYGLDRRERARTVDGVLSLTDLADKRRDSVDVLSRGMKQRLGLARVLLHDPKLLLLDEPASGLDPRARIEIRELLKELKKMGKTILISSHILHELSELCTRIGILEAGKLVAEGSLEEIYRRARLGRVVHVELAETADGLLDRIRAIPGVEAVEPGPDRTTIRLADATLAPEDLLEALGRVGARVRMFQPGAIDLETLFMKLTQGKLA